MAWLEMMIMVMKMILRLLLKVWSMGQELEHHWELVRNEATL